MNLIKSITENPGKLISEAIKDNPRFVYWLKVVYGSVTTSVFPVINISDEYVYVKRNTADVLLKYDYCSDNDGNLKLPIRKFGIPDFWSTGSCLFTLDKSEFEIMKIELVEKTIENLTEYLVGIDPRKRDPIEECVFLLEEYLKDNQKSIKESSNQPAPIIAYHGTEHVFEIFNTNPENQMGAHFGSYEQASEFAMVGEFIFKVELTFKNLYEMQRDLGDWSDIESWQIYFNDWEANGEGHLNLGEEEIENLQTAEDVRNLLVSKGHDGIKYPNQFEGNHSPPNGGGGDGNLSYIAFYPEQITILNKERY